MIHSGSFVGDLHVQRTEKLLLEALIELTIQKGFAALTVSDLVKYAGVNRATFYRHYEDKFDLLNAYAQNVYALFEAMPQKSDAEQATMVAPGLVAIFKHIRTHARFYRVMLGKNGNPLFAETIRGYIQKRMWCSLPAGLQKEGQSADLYLSSSASASAGAVLWWLEHDMPYSPAEMATISYQLGTNLSVMLSQPEC